MKNYFIAVSIIKKNKNNEIEDIEFMNYVLELDKISCLDDIHGFERMVKDDLIESGYIENEEEKGMYNVTVISLQRLD
ncbi:hypothetical protein II582_05005 [bacterium]|nr:hypothetical protein [bacterium]